MDDHKIEGEVTLTRSYTVDSAKYTLEEAWRMYKAGELEPDDNTDWSDAQEDESTARIVLPNAASWKDKVITSTIEITKDGTEVVSVEHQMSDLALALHELVEAESHHNCNKSLPCYICRPPR